MLEYTIWKKLGEGGSFYTAMGKPSFLSDIDFSSVLLCGETPHPYSVTKASLTNLFVRLSLIGSYLVCH